MIALAVALGAVGFACAIALTIKQVLTIGASIGAYKSNNRRALAREASCNEQ